MARKTKTTEDFIKDARKVHGDKYDYSKTRYVKSSLKVTITCPIHGDFWQTPNNHLRGTGCPKCKNSLLETKVRILLEENNIEYIPEKSIRDLTNEMLGDKPQRVDFYLPKHNLCIECQGEQHFLPVPFGKMSEDKSKKQFDKNVIMEIRGGTGGEEAALFASTLMRMYSMYAESKRWNIDVTNVSETELGGYKEVSFMIEGDGAYSRLKFESGVHRVQRVPDTESQGRIHTSTVTVAVLPEVDDVEIEINPADLQVDTYRASGAGGQHVNKTESAIRITHLPTGLVVECQDERSQHKNRDKAMKVLRSRLYEQAQKEQTDKIASERKSQVGTGDRSERIRTYNYPQGRVSEHRIGLTIYHLEQTLNGDLDEIIDALITADQAEKLKAEAN